MSTTRSWPQAPRSPSCAPRSNSNRDPQPDRATRTTAIDQQNRRRALQHLADHPAHARCREIRCGAAIPPRCVDRRMETRPRRRPALTESAATTEHRRCIHEPGRGRLGRRRGPPPARPAHHRGDALDVKDRIAALHLGPLLTDAERRYLTLRCHLRGLVRTRRAGHRRRADHPADQPPAAPCPGAPPPHLRGARLRSHPRSARPPHPALGRRRRNRTGQSRAGLSLPPPAAPSRRHHHHRTRRPARRHRQRRGDVLTDASLARPPTKPPPAVPPYRDPSANAPTGGGTSPSNRNHHRANN